MMRFSPPTLGLFHALFAATLNCIWAKIQDFASDVINVRQKMYSPKACLLEQTFCKPCLQLPGLSIIKLMYPGSLFRFTQVYQLSQKKIRTHRKTEDRHRSKHCRSTSSIKPLFWLQRGRMVMLHLS